MNDNMRVHARYLDDVCATGAITVVPKMKKRGRMKALMMDRW